MVAAGGALGSMARDLITQHLHAPAGEFPTSTLIVNLAGALALGLAHTALFPQHPSLRPLVAIGFLGSFTTFSGFTVAVVDTARLDHTTTAVVYAVATVAGGLAAAWTGLRVGTQLAQQVSKRQR